MVSGGGAAPSRRVDDDLRREFRTTSRIIGRIRRFVAEAPKIGRDSNRDRELKGSPPKVKIILRHKYVGNYI